MKRTISEKIRKADRAKKERREASVAARVAVQSEVVRQLLSDGWSRREISDVLGVSAETTRRRIKSVSFGPLTEAQTKEARAFLEGEAKPKVRSRSRNSQNVAQQMETIRRLVSEGWQRNVIAKHLGVSAATVSGRCRAMGLSRRYQVTVAEKIGKTKRILDMLADGHSRASIASILGISANTVSLYVKEVGVPVVVRKFP